MGSNQTVTISSGGTFADMYTSANPYAFWHTSRKDCRAGYACWPDVTSEAMFAGNYSLTVTVPAGYTVSHNITDADYGSGSFSGNVANFYCGHYVAVDWYFTPICTETGPHWSGVCTGSPATETGTMDCGGAPQTRSCTGSIAARAMVISGADISCNAVYTATSPVPGTTMGFTAGSASNPARQGPIGQNYYAPFPGLVGGSYTLAPQVAPGYYLQAACWKKLLNAPLSGTGLSQSLSEPTPGDTLTWDLGYTLGTPWAAVQGGDVYAAQNLSSYIPTGNLFITAGAGGYPGIATYGNTYDFDFLASSQGESLVSPTNWLVHDSVSPIDYYQLFYQRFGGKPTTVDYVAPSAPVAQPTSRAAPYYVTGDMTTTGNWVVPAGQSLIFIIDGNLTIGGSINVTGNGFVSFIVGGDITVDPTVGVAYTSSAPVVEGVYIARGTIHTGKSTSVGNERFVGKGIFVAGNTFALERSLDTISHNQDTSAEFFIYNPQFLITMPDAMRETNVTWKEVAP